MRTTVFLIGLSVLSASVHAAPKRRKASHSFNTNYVTGPSKIAQEGTWKNTSALLTLCGDSYCQYCAATLISANWALTAAHCPVKRGDQIVVGTVDLSKGGIGISVEEFIPHEDFSPKTFKNDVALVKLHTSRQLSDRWTEGGEPADQIPGKKVVAMGWGRVSTHGDYSLQLREVEIPIQDNSACAAQYRGNYDITDSMLCAGDGVRDACQGDSGGPLVSLHGSTIVQVGVVSFGIGCGTKNHYGVYTRIASFIPWVRKYVPDFGLAAEAAESQGGSR